MNTSTLKSFNPSNRDQNEGIYFNNSRKAVEEIQQLKFLDKKRSSHKSNWKERTKNGQRNNNWNKTSSNINSQYSRNKSFKEVNTKSCSLSKAEKNNKAKNSKKSSQYVNKSIKQSWRSTLRQETNNEAQRRKAENNYAIKRIKLSNEKIKAIISDQYKIFRSSHPSLQIAYEDYVERLIDSNLISDNENKVLLKSLKDYVPIIIMNTWELLICKKKTVHCIFNKTSKQIENVVEDRLDTLNNSIYNSFVQGINRYEIQQHRIKFF